jgi:hypothetical protein
MFHVLPSLWLLSCDVFQRIWCLGDLLARIREDESGRFDWLGSPTMLHSIVLKIVLKLFVKPVPVMAAASVARTDGAPWSQGGVHAPG